MMLDDRGVHALGKVSEERKLAELARADVLCAPSLHGESFGMVLTEAFAAGTPVLASDIPGLPRRAARRRRRAARARRATRSRSPRRCAGSRWSRALRARMAAAARERAERFAWPHVADEVLDCYEQALAVGVPATRLARAAVRYGLAPADLQPRIPAERLPSLPRRDPRSGPPPSASDGARSAGRRPPRAHRFAPRAHAAPARPGRQLAARRGLAAARARAHRRRPGRRLPARVQARARRRRPGR